MDQPDLDRRAVIGRAGRLAAFAAIGALLVAGKRLVVRAPAGEPALVVEVAAGAGGDAIARAAADALLIDEALRARWPLRDPVVRARIAEIGEIAEDLPERELAAIDPVIRARLAWIGRALIRAELEAPAPGAAELDAFRAAHPGRYAPGWLAFSQRSISRARHGARAEADAQALAEALAGAGAGAPGGDPSLLPARIAATPAAVDARFGAGFAARVAAAPVGRWSGPHAGTFGFHVVWREDAASPDHAVDARVARDWAHDRREAMVREAIEARLARRRLEVREVAP